MSHRSTSLHRVCVSTVAIVVASGLGIACSGSRNLGQFDFETDASTAADSSPNGSLDDPSAQADASGNTFLRLDGALACASSSVKAELTPVNLVIMYDKSGSMGDQKSNAAFDPELKWNPVNAGMKAFFTDTGSVNLSASLTFFPVDGDLATACAGPYDKPKVTMTPLSEPAPLVNVLDTTKPYGGTPTLPALKGAVAYARQLIQEDLASKTVIVLVTDGEPGFQVDNAFVPACPGNDNDISHVADVARAAFAQSPSIPTYVIGIGPSLDKLNAIAAAGGTGSATMVSVSDPSQTKLQFKQALDAIRTVSVSCDIAMPKSSGVGVVDTTLVNVTLKHGNAEEELLGYNPGCSGDLGWQYDDDNEPSWVRLCPTSCQAARNDPNSQLSIVLGCKTYVQIK